MTARNPGRGGGRVFWWVLGGIVLVGVVVTVVVAAGGDDESSSGAVETADEVTVDGEQLPQLVDPSRDPAVGRPAPALEGVGFDGAPVRTPSGEPHVVVFLAHWCPHCQAEVPRIVALEERGGTEGVAVLAVATGTSADAPNFPPSAWLEREHWPYPVLVDTAAGTAAGAYGLASYPMLVFVDAQGAVAGRVSGEVPESELAAMFAALAEGRPVPVPGGGEASPR